MKAKHSEFYYKLKNLKDRIVVFQDMFYDKIPHFQLAFLKKQLQRREEKQKREREEFLAEMEIIKQQQKRKIHKLQSSADVLELGGLQRLSTLNFKGASPTRALQFGQKAAIQSGEKDLALVAKSSSVNVKSLAARKRQNPARFASSHGLMVGTFQRRSTILSKQGSQMDVARGLKRSLQHSPSNESNKAEFDDILD